MDVTTNERSRLRQAMREHRQRALVALRCESLDLSARTNRKMREIKARRLQRSRWEAENRLQYVTTLASDVAALLRQYQQQRLEGGRERSKYRRKFVVDVRDSIQQRLTTFRQRRLEAELARQREGKAWNDAAARVLLERARLETGSASATANTESPARRSRGTRRRSKGGKAASD